MHLPQRNWFLRFPACCLLVTAAALLCCLPPLSRLRVDTQTRVLLEGDQRNLSSYEKVMEILASEAVLVVSMEHTNLFSREGIGAVRRVSQAFASLRGVADVKSLTHSVKPVRRGFSFAMEPLVTAETDAALAALREFCLSHPLMRNVMVSADGTHALLTVTFQRAFSSPLVQRSLRQDIDRILEPFEKEGPRFTLLSVPLIEDELRATFARDTRLIIPFGVVLVSGILWLALRSWRALFLIFINLSFAFIFVSGLWVTLGFELNIFSVVLLPLLAAIQLTLLLHVYLGAQRAWHAGRRGAEGISTMLGEVQKPCAFSTITALFASLSLALSEVKPVHDFGLMAVIGLGVIHGLTFGPGVSLATLCFNWTWKSSHAGASPVSTLPTLVMAWLEIVRRRRSLFLIICLGQMLLAALLAGRIRTDLRAVEFLSRRSPTRLAVEKLDRVFGGINVVQIEFDSGHAGGVNSPQFLGYLDEVQKMAASRPAFSGAYAYPQVLSMMNEIWEGGREGSFRVPENAVLRTLFVTALNAGRYPFLRALCDPEGRVAYLVLRSRDMPVGLYLKSIDEVLAYASKAKLKGVRVSAQSGIHTILESDRRIVDSQLKSVGATFVMIFFSLAGLWRSFTLPWLSIAANAIPLAVVVSLAAAFDVPLNSITILVGAISLGIMADDSVHLLTSWREHRRAGLHCPEALHVTCLALARPMVFASSVLIAILLLFSLSSFPPVRHFGLLSAAGLASAAVAVFSFLPAMLASSKPRSTVS